MIDAAFRPVSDDPIVQLSRDIMKLPIDKRIEIFDQIIDDLPEIQKREFLALLPCPLDEKEEKLIKNLDDDMKASNADYVATKLPTKERTELSHKVKELLRDVQNEADNKKKEGAAHQEKGHPAPHHATVRHHSG